MIAPVLQSVDSSRDATVEGLKEFLRMPSVSTKPEHKKDLERCAQWVAGKLNAIGLKAEVKPTGGHPAVVARNEHKPSRPTVLFYGHYDVQPPEPLDKWITPPFEPTVRNGAIFARGAVDDKGQVWAHLQAIAAWQKHGGVPVNLKLLIEGEEEIGSENLERFVNAQRDALKADIAVVSDTNQYARGIPAITYGLRGLVYSEVFVTGADHDTHSGLYGGAIPNPANILCQLLGELHDPSGRVTVPGFYDDVRPLTKEERDAWAKLPFDESQFLKELNLAAPMGEAGYSAIERSWARPTCDINGLTSGYQGHGAKTIIPSTASAKVSMRLVPDQDPAKIAESFEKMIRDRCPKAVKLEFARHSAAPPVLVPREGKAMQLATDALREGFGAAPTLIRSGGSIPVVGLIKQVLGIDTLLVGFGLPDDRVHSPNEKFDLDALHGGTRTAAVLYGKLAQL
ncbi:MAG TPA: dipeptidase [Tepidisphaeraceae bacterium]|jgi:acetylornithine deacetylase/succinyl-diaminopimelate desuccinylase-like protein|nr:dipeptidase [Tepidisphaeraceae bacterium]